jgi:hypothetical protein
MIGNMGSIFVILILTPAFVLLQYILIKLIPSEGVCKYDLGFNKYVKPKLQANLKELFWNGVIDFLNQGYLILLLMAFINLRDVRLGLAFSFSENLNSSLAIIWTLIATIFPFIILVIYCKKIETPLPELDPSLDVP